MREAVKIALAAFVGSLCGTLAAQIVGTLYKLTVELAAELKC